MDQTVVSWQYVYLSKCKSVLLPTRTIGTLQEKNQDQCHNVHFVSLVRSSDCKINKNWIPVEDFCANIVA